MSTDKNIYIDFAHTPEALEAVLKALRSIKPSKLICVFGCGGNRDRSKRSAMGRIAEMYCDKIILTSDNPRNETAENIISDIECGIRNKKLLSVEKDRAEAIRMAIETAHSDDIVLIAGKGHEEYQLIGGNKIYYSDVATVKTLLGLI